MSVTAELLRELHRILQQLDELGDRLTRGPRVLKAREAGVAQLEAALAKAQGEAKAMRVMSDQKNLALRAGEDKIKQLKAKLMAANNNREYQALQEQINADLMANSVLSDEILESLDKIEDLKKVVQEAEQELAKGKAEFAKQRQLVTEQEGSLRADVARLKQDLATAEEKLPADMRAEYNRIVGTKGSDGMAAVENNACDGCCQSLQVNLLSELRLGKLVYCKSCGRILYLPEERQMAGKG